MKQNLKWSIASLFFITTMIAGFLVGYDRGFDAGKNQWMNLPVYTKQYELHSIINAKINERLREDVGASTIVKMQDFDEIVAKLKSNVFPDVWILDPNTRVDVSVPSLSIVVNANGAIHREVERFFVVEVLEAKQGIANYRYPKN